MKTVSIHLIFLILFSCIYVDSRLKIINTNVFEIAVEACEDTINTNLNQAEFFLLSDQKIIPGDTQQMETFGGKNAWPVFIHASKNQKLNLFVYRIDTINKYMDMDFIRRKRLYIKRISISEAELNERNWLVPL